MVEPTFSIGPSIGTEEENAVLDTLRSGQLASGPEVDNFEHEFAAFVGANRAVACSSGTTALMMALRAVDIGPKDEVIVPALSFVATANVVIALGATPVFAEIDASTFTIDPSAVERMITARTKAVVAVHLYGLPADLDRLSEICSSARVALIEDAAQAHGASWSGRRVGSWGTAAFSFYATKNMTTGEGGMLTTADPSVAERARSYADHGRVRSSRDPYEHPHFGLNFRLSDIAASIGRVQLRKLPALVEARGLLADGIREVVPETWTQRVPSEACHAYHLFPLLAPDREALAANLKEEGLPFGVFYPAPLYEMSHSSPRRRCPVADEISGRLLCLRMSAYSPDVIEHYVAQVKRACK
jgi:dTDP-4-amino-4,6-dideoxygalactose transaminase